MRLVDLITNPSTGRLSTSDAALFFAFLISSVVLLYCTFTNQLNEWLFTAYLTAWVVQCQASKRAAIERDSISEGSKID